LLNEIKFDNDLILDGLEIYIRLIKLESEEDSNSFPVETYNKLIHSIFLESINGKLLNDGTNDSILVQEFNNNYLNKFDDFKYYFLSEINSVLSDLKDSNFKSDEYSEAQIQSIFSNEYEEEEEEDDDIKKEIYFIKNPVSVVKKQAIYFKKFEENWFIILSNPNLLKIQLKTTLLILHKKIIPYLNKPSSLMDFLTDCYNLNDDLVIQILSLNGLFELIKDYNLDYPDFYNKLYKLFLNPLILSNNYKSRLFRLVEVFFNSTHLPINLLASFIKKMSRLSLNNSSSSVVIIIPFIYNLIKKHPNLMILIHNIKENENPNYKDPFNNNEENVYKTNAIDSSLWELETMMTHYHPNIATLAKIFKEPFRKMSYNMEDFLDWSYQGLLDSEKKRRFKGEIGLEFEEWEQIFAEYKEKSEDEVSSQSVYLEGWSL
ncbi:ribosome biosynthesis protein NOC4, partial [Ascoidea rubescens DSM 1968]